MSYVVKRIDYGRDRGVVYGPVEDRQEAIEKAQRYAEGRSEGSRVDPVPFQEKDGDVWEIEGYAKCGLTIFEVREVDD